MRRQDEVEAVAGFPRVAGFERAAVMAAAAWTALALGPGLDYLAAQEASDPADVADLDAIIAAYYDVISGPAGEVADRERDRSLHHPDALVGISGVDGEGQPFLRTMSLDEYHDAFGGARQEAFYEREIHREARRFGNVAHVWSTYASSREPEGEPFARGINSIQLYHDGSRWWIMGWIFDSERQGNPIPPEYLP